MAGSGRTQKNKAHKARFASKSHRNKHKQETVARESGTPGSLPVHHASLSKTQRLQQAKQLRDKKKGEILEKKRAQGSVRDASSSLLPKIMLVIGLSAEVDTSLIVRNIVCHVRGSYGLEEERQGSVEISENSSMVQGLSGACTIFSAKYNSRFTILEAKTGDLLGALEMAKVADVILFVASVSPPSDTTTPSLTPPSSLLSLSASQRAENDKKKKFDSSSVATSSKAVAFSKVSTSEKRARELIDESGRTVLTALRALGMPSALIGIVQTKMRPNTHEIMPENNAADEDDLKMEIGDDTKCPNTSSNTSSKKLGKLQLKIAEKKKEALSVFLNEFSDSMKVFDADRYEGGTISEGCGSVRNDVEFDKMFRHISEKHSVVHPPSWRSCRSYIMAHEVRFVPSSQNTSVLGNKDGMGELSVSGFVRGRGLSVNQLVHLAGVGDFQLSKIELLNDPFPSKRSLSLLQGKSNERTGEKKEREKGGSKGVEQSEESMVVDCEEREGEVERGRENDEGVRVLAVANPNFQEQLVVENCPDSLNAEQTWPTESELREASLFRKGEREKEMEGGREGERGKGEKRVKRIRVPKGTSVYQASWYAEESEEEEEGEEGRGEESVGKKSVNMRGGKEGEVEGGESRRDEAMEGEVDMGEIEEEDEERREKGGEEGEDMGGRERTKEDGKGRKKERKGEDEEGVEEREEEEWEDVDGDSKSVFSTLMDEEGERDRDEEWRKREREREKRERADRDEEEDRKYPDEIDTPTGIAARVRFSKFRGLKSFRTSPWDPKESLPSEYSKIFSFDNFNRAKKYSLSKYENLSSVFEQHNDEEKDHLVPLGTFVRVNIKGVRQRQADQILQQCAHHPEGSHDNTMRQDKTTTNRTFLLSLWGLFPFESRVSVLHFKIKKCSNTENIPVRSKQPLVFHCGFRRFRARPIFSTDDSNNDKHKLERFLPYGCQAVASVFAPITFPPCPLLAFLPADPEKGHPTGPTSLSSSRAPSLSSPPPSLSLLATGSLQSVDPDRVVLKKIVLSGYPYGVTKRKAVVRFMFHCPEDVRWFQPIELFTKYGKRGRIVEPVGTKGNMKCVFDGTVQQKDSVCIALYKRVFPKWVPLDDEQEPFNVL